MVRVQQVVLRVPVDVRQHNSKMRESHVNRNPLCCIVGHQPKNPCVRCIKMLESPKSSTAVMHSCRFWTGGQGTHTQEELMDVEFSQSLQLKIILFGNSDSLGSLLKEGVVTLRSAAGAARPRLSIYMKGIVQLFFLFSFHWLLRSAVR